MKAFGRFLIVLLLLGNLAYMGAMTLHVVQSPTGIAVVPKGQTSLLETYVDTRLWSASDLREHPAFISDLNRAGKTRLISHLDGSVTTITPAAIPSKVADKPASAVPESADKNIFDFTK